MGDIFKPDDAAGVYFTTVDPAKVDQGFYDLIGIDPETPLSAIQVQERTLYLLDGEGVPDSPVLQSLPRLADYTERFSSYDFEWAADAEGASRESSVEAAGEYLENAGIGVQLEDIEGMKDLIPEEEDDDPNPGFETARKRRDDVVGETPEEKARRPYHPNTPL